MFFVVVAGFIPRVAVEVADKPNVIHLITRGGHLLVSVAASDAKAIAVFGFIWRVALKACAEAL